MKNFTLILLSFIGSWSAFAQTNTLPEIVLVPWASGFTNPVDIENADGGRMFVVEQPGTIQLVTADGTNRTEFLNIVDRVESSGFEQGLLGLAFDPDYGSNGFFYVHYTNKAKNSQFSRFSVDPNNSNKALPQSEVKMLEDDDPYDNHNGGQMQFGPDGYLYFTLGDGGNAGDPGNRAQDVTEIFGKLMRIDPQDNGTYAIPATNPYAGVVGAREEIWATGLRNAWRFSFDLVTGDIWIADVGQDRWEEIDFQPYSSAGGENYGWSCREGLHFYKGNCDQNGVSFTDPIAEYAHSDADTLDCGGSVTGGFVYRGNIYPNMYGKYLYTDFCTGVMRTTYWNGTAWTSAEIGNFTPYAYSTFGEHQNGELLLADKTNGIIYTITDKSQTTSIPPSGELTGLNSLTLTPNPNDGNYTIRFNSDHPETYTLNLFDNTGRKVWQERKQAIEGANEWAFTNATLSTGYYFLQIQSPTGTSTLHFVTR